MLETDITKLNMNELEIEYEVDPLFRRMTCLFNDIGAKNMLLNNLPVPK